MSYSVNGTTITLTRGDTLRLKVGIINQDGSEYVPTLEDSIRFAMKKKYSDESTLILKEIPSDTLMLQLDPEDTKSLEFGTYVYDIQITLSDGTVDTFIPKSKIKISEEVE